jgi:fucose permease
MHFARRLGQNYAFVVVAAIFVTLLVSAGSRGAPGVLILPLEEAFGWSRSAISFAAAVGIFLYGLIGPFAVALMDRFGLRRTLIGALIILASAMAATSLVREAW